MASVKQFSPTGPYYACFREPTGAFRTDGKPIFKRTQKATGLYDKSAAMMIAMSCEEVAKAAAAKRHTELMARSFLEKVTAATNVSTAQTISLREHLEQWFKSKSLLVSKNTKANYETTLTQFLSFVEKKNVVSLADVSHHVINEFRDHELMAGKSGGTINKALNILGQAFRLAVASQALRTNPVDGLRVTGARNRPQSRRPFTFEQFCLLYAATNPNKPSKRGVRLHEDWQTLILICAYTGGRQQEVSKLTWEQVDLANSRIWLKRTKGADLHQMPMHPAVRKHLLARKRKAGEKTGLIMTNLGTKPGRTLSKHFREFVLPRVGIRQPYSNRVRQDEVDSVRQVGRKVAEFGLHSLRHSLNTWLNAEGVPEMTRMRLVGHRNADVSRRYTHEDHLQLSAALQKVPDVFGDAS